MDFSLILRALHFSFILCFLTACGGGSSNTSTVQNPQAVADQDSRLPLHSDYSYSFSYSNGNQVSNSKIKFHAQRGSDYIYQLEASSGFREYLSSSSTEGIKLFGAFFNDVDVSGVGKFDVDLEFDLPASLLPIGASVGYNTEVTSDKGSVTISPRYGRRSLDYSVNVYYYSDGQLLVLGQQRPIKVVRYYLVAHTTIDGYQLQVSIDETLYLVDGMGIVGRIDNGTILSLASWSFPDKDKDGVSDLQDAFPDNNSEYADFDGDGIGDHADQDDDNDGIADTLDSVPLVADVSVDLDLDGIGDSLAPDSDRDGVRDPNDLEPNNPLVWVNFPPSISTLNVPTPPVSPGQLITLDASASTDTDGQIQTWTWELLDRSDISLIGHDTPEVRFSVPESAFGQELHLRLTITDDGGAVTSQNYSIPIKSLFDREKIRFGLNQNTLSSALTSSIPILTNDTNLEINLSHEDGFLSNYSLEPTGNSSQVYRLVVTLDPTGLGRLNNGDANRTQITLSIAASDGSSSEINLPIEITLDFPEVSWAYPVTLLEGSRASLTFSGRHLRTIESQGLWLGNTEIIDLEFINDDLVKVTTPPLTEIGSVRFEIPNSLGIPAFDKARVAVIESPAIPETIVVLGSSDRSYTPLLSQYDSKRNTLFTVDFAHLFSMKLNAQGEWQTDMVDYVEHGPYGDIYRQFTAIDLSLDGNSLLLTRHGDLLVRNLSTLEEQIYYGPGDYNLMAFELLPGRRFMISYEDDYFFSNYPGGRTEYPIEPNSYLRIQGVVKNYSGGKMLLSHAQSPGRRRDDLYLYDAYTNKLEYWLEVDDIYERLSINAHGTILSNGNNIYDGNLNQIGQLPEGNNQVQISSDGRRAVVITESRLLKVYDIEHAPTFFQIGSDINVSHLSQIKEIIITDDNRHVFITDVVDGYPDDQLRVTVKNLPVE